ncbi:MAG TPA: hypothetical protein VHX38_35520 [Pseudonocardiaceae bacterium]|nr:hypothetical protein [Pseudonocardiaceae bacterium]
MIRTDLGDDEVWKTIVAVVRKSSVEYGLLSHLGLLDEPVYRGLTKDQLVNLVPTTPEYEHSFLLVVDDTTVSSAERLVLVVDLLEEPGRAFRAIPATVLLIESCLSVINVKFSELADMADEAGFFH